MLTWLLNTLLFLNPVFANSMCFDLFATPHLQPSEDRPVQFTEVEVFRRNNDVGIQQMGSIVLEKWLYFEPFTDDIQSYFGLTHEGKLYHVMQWKNADHTTERTFAKLLSGDMEIQSLFLYQRDILVAVDKNSHVFLYQPTKWLAKNSLKKIIAKGAAITGATTLTLTSIIQYFFPDVAAMGIDISSLHIPMMTTFIGTATGLNSLFFSFYKYELGNTFPNGLVPLQSKYTTDSELKKHLQQLSTNQLSQYQTLDHFKPQDRQTFVPRLPKIATEDIR